jgi:hypothetical protein
VDAAFGDMGKDREITIVVEEEMQFDRPFRPPEGGPVEKGGAKVDHGGVQTEELVLEAEFLSWRNGLALIEKLIEHPFVELPGAFLIRIGERGPGGGRFYTQMLELAETA